MHQNPPISYRNSPKIIWGIKPDIILIGQYKLYHSVKTKTTDEEEIKKHLFSEILNQSRIFTVYCLIGDGCADRDTAERFPALCSAICLKRQRNLPLNGDIQARRT